MLNIGQHCSLTQANNLTLNIAKSQEILFSDKRRKEKFSAPAGIV